MKHLARLAAVLLVAPFMASMVAFCVVGLVTAILAGAMAKVAGVARQ
jgi:phosphopantothenoylcysteine synthetase/decarboxylase